MALTEENAHLRALNEQYLGQIREQAKTIEVEMAKLRAEVEAIRRIGIDRAKVIAAERDAALLQIDELKAFLKSIDKRVKDDGPHRADCPGSHLAYCICLSGEIRRGIKMTLEGKSTEKPKCDTCENVRKDGGEVVGIFCTTFASSKYLAHSPTCQFAVKRNQEPHKYEHGDDVSDDAMRG